MAVRVTCIRKSGGYHENPYTAISSMNWVEDGGGRSGSNTRLEMYEFVKSGGQAYVLSAWGTRAYLMTAESAQGTKYVKTEPNNTTADNLLKLPECYP